LKRTDVWYVDPSGQNLNEVIEDAKKAIREIGLPWFSRFTDLNEVLRTLHEDSESHEGTWGFGTKTSPMRHFMTGFTALAVGQTGSAKEHLQKALASGCFEEFEPEMHSALAEIGKQVG
jgi:hypothetical protein